VASGKHHGEAIDPFDAERLRALLDQTTDRRERARLRGFLQYATPEARAAHGDLTRQKMSTPVVRGHLLDTWARRYAPQLIVLREAWQNAAPEIRQQFLAEVANVVPKEQGGS
jgi:hypothetical protein